MPRGLLEAKAQADRREGAGPDIDPVVVAIAVALALEVEPIEAVPDGDLRVDLTREADDGAGP